MFWNRLTKQKQNNVKIDWSKWIVSDDDNLFDSQLQTIMNNVYNKSTLQKESLNNKSKSQVITTNLNGLDCFSEILSDTSDD